MNTILGGSFSSRLNLNLREKRGYTYGASSGFDMRLTPGPFSAQAGVQTDKTSESLTEFFNELNGDPEDGAGRRTGARQELRRAPIPVVVRDDRRHRPAARRRASSTACPTTTTRVTCRTSRPITAADVQRVAQKYIQPDRLAVVVVGDRKTIEPGIRALNLGAITPLAIDEIFK